MADRTYGIRQQQRALRLAYLPPMWQRQLCFRRLLPSVRRTLDEADNTLALSDDPGATPEKNHVIKAAPTERAFTSTARKLWRWESALGFVLLALTLGYALFTWRNDTTHAMLTTRAWPPKREWTGMRPRQTSTRRAVCATPCREETRPEAKWSSATTLTSGV